MIGSNNQQTTPRTMLMAFLGAIPIVLIISLLTVLGLVVATSKTKKNNTTSLNASQVISAYSQPEAIASLTSKTYEQQNIGSGTLTYKLSPHTYSVNQETSNFVNFYATNTSVKDDTKTVTTQTDTFMKNHGLTKDDFTPKSSDSTYSTYSNGVAICQLENSVKPSNPVDYVQQHTLACADKTTLETEYSKTDKLLKLYTTTEKLPQFNQSIRYQKDDSNKSYAILNLISESKKYSLLFASVDNDWEYVGDLINSTPDRKSGNYTISQAMYEKISAAKYGDFITSDIH
jgi:hypothetical protein